MLLKDQFEGKLKFIDKLINLNLDLNEYVIFGSGPLAIRNIRVNNDIDIIVKQDYWNYLTKLYNIKSKSKFVIGNIEICSDWLPYIDDLNKIFNSKEIINNFPYAKLEYVIEWKQKHSRKKDILDLKLIKDYLNKY
jgi:hypothetical protein